MNLEYTPSLSQGHCIWVSLLCNLCELTNTSWSSKGCILYLLSHIVLNHRLLTWPCRALWSTISIYRPCQILYLDGTLPSLRFSSFSSSAHKPSNQQMFQMVDHRFWNYQWNQWVECKCLVAHFLEFVYHQWKIWLHLYLFDRDYHK